MPRAGGFISGSMLSLSVPPLWGHLHPAPSHPISLCPLLPGAAEQQRGAQRLVPCASRDPGTPGGAVLGSAVSRGLRTTSRCRGRAGGCGGLQRGPGRAEPTAAGAEQQEPSSRAPLRPVPARWGWPPAQRCSPGARGSPLPRAPGAVSLELPACPVCARCGPAPEQDEGPRAARFASQVPAHRGGHRRHFVHSAQRRPGDKHLCALPPAAPHQGTRARGLGSPGEPPPRPAAKPNPPKPCQDFAQGLPSSWANVCPMPGSHPDSCFPGEALSGAHSPCSATAQGAMSV